MTHENNPTICPHLTWKNDLPICKELDRVNNPSAHISQYKLRGCCMKNGEGCIGIPAEVFDRFGKVGETTYKVVPRKTPSTFIERLLKTLSTIV